MHPISAWAIRNPLPPILLFIALLLGGIAGLQTLDVNSSPDISFPAIEVTIVQSGAAPTELESQVTQRVEAAARAVNGVDEILSRVNEGTSRTLVQFSIGTPIDRALNDIRDAVAKIRGDLPGDILEPQIERLEVDGEPIARFAITFEDKSVGDLSWYVDSTLTKRLLDVPGVAEVKRIGGVNRELRVVLDPVAMQSLGISAYQVSQQLRRTNFNSAGGRFEIMGSEQAVRVLGNTPSAHALSKTNIMLGGGRTVRLGSVARVTDGHAEQRSLAKMNGREFLGFTIAKAKGSSDLAVYDQTRKALRDLEAENPSVRFTELSSTVHYTRNQYGAAIQALYEGALLAVFVVWLFLRDFRATLISAVAIPLSAIPTFGFMVLMGFSLNFMSLLALSLVAGVLVDDAIVEIENIVRHMRMGKSAYQASIDAADEIGLAVVATTFSIVAVFLPVGLMPGVSGQFFQQFGMTVVVAVLTSLAVARLITPMLAAFYLKPFGRVSHHDGSAMRAYLKILRWSMLHRWKVMAVGAGALVATVFGYATLPSAFKPATNNDFSTVNIELPSGNTLAHTTAVVDELAGILQSQAEVESTVAEIGVGRARVDVTLADDRELSSVEFERRMQTSFEHIPDARIAFQSQESGTGRDISVLLSSEDSDRLHDMAARLVAQMQTIPELRSPRIEGDMPRPEILISPRFDLAAELGVTTEALGEAVRIASIGDIDRNVAKFSIADRQIPIRVVIDEASRRNFHTLRHLLIPTADGRSVPLHLVADIEFGSGPTEIRRYAQRRRVVVSADLAPSAVSGDAMEKINTLPILASLPPGIERIEFGASRLQAEMISSFVIAVLAGVLLVFAVLVLLYRKLLPPLVNIGSLLLAPMGGAIALHMTGNILSMPVFIGVLMLLGIVAKNSILLIDFAVEEINRGADQNQAIIDASHKRAQPIIMTTVAMIAGMVPTAVSIYGDSAWRSPMGVTVIGGLLFSTFLTLVIVPPAFSLACDAESWLKNRFVSSPRGRPPLIDPLLEERQPIEPPSTP